MVVGSNAILFISCRVLLDFSETKFWTLTPSTEKKANDKKLLENLNTLKEYLMNVNAKDDGLVFIAGCIFFQIKQWVCMNRTRKYHSIYTVGLFCRFCFLYKNAGNKGFTVKQF